MTLVPAKDGLGYIRKDDPGEPIVGKPRISITDAEALILGGLVLGKTVLEIGTGLGVSTRALAKYASSVTSIDIDSWVQQTIWPELQQEFANVAFATGRIAQRVDVVFIDGDHDTDAVRSDIAYARTCLSPNGLMIAHDVNYENVQRALDGRWQLIPTEHGLGVLAVDA